MVHFLPQRLIDLLRSIICNHFAEVFAYGMSFVVDRAESRISIEIPEVDELIKKDIYPSRAESIRTAIRDLLKKELWSVKYKINEEKGD